jgi:hypothetical protein
MLSKNIFAQLAALSVVAFNSLSLVTGFYLNVDVQLFYFGEYSQRSDARILFPGSTYEVKSNSQVVLHEHARVSGRLYK